MASRMALHSCLMVSSLLGFVTHVKASVGSGCPDGANTSSTPVMRENVEYKVTRFPLRSAVIWRVMCHAYLSSSPMRGGVEEGSSEHFSGEDCSTNIIEAKAGFLAASLGRGLGLGPSTPNDLSLSAMVGCQVRSPCSLINPLP